jgi:hypothetical protein
LEVYQHGKRLCEAQFPSLFWHEHRNFLMGSNTAGKKSQFLSHRTSHKMTLSKCLHRCIQCSAELRFSMACTIDCFDNPDMEGLVCRYHLCCLVHGSKNTERHQENTREQAKGYGAGYLTVCSILSIVTLLDSLKVVPEPCFE